MTAEVRRVLFDDGVGRGVEALSFSTGGGLDFSVLIDRSLDIGPLSWRGRAVGWQGPSGYRHPAGHDPYADHGRGFGRLFSGFLVTCGLEHTRQPADDHPMHGRLPFTPAKMTASGADWKREEPALFCEGEVVQPGFRLKRRIEAPIGRSSLTIADTVENLSTMPQRQASLYHFNLGAPALAAGTVVESGERRVLGPLEVPDEKASREAASRPVNGGPAACRVVTRDIAIDFAWSADTLPHLQLWHDLRPCACVLSVEPCTSERLPDGRSGEEPILGPGDIRRYALSVSFCVAPQ
jgi:hypothetical protein